MMASAIKEGVMESQDDQPRTDFHFLPAYAHLIAEAANRWAYLEFLINQAIWALAELKPAIGACLTSQLYTFPAKMNALVSLMKLRRVSEKLLKKTNKFASNARAALDARNRAVHDVWVNDNFNPEQMGKLRITADSTLKFEIEQINGDKLLAEMKLIEKNRVQAQKILQEIKDELPTLPEIPSEELYPIVEIQQDQ
jgi:hypothetical protein